MQRIEKLLTTVSNRFNVVAAGAVVLIMLIIVLDVVFRQFRMPVPGAFDIVGLLGSLVISFSLGYTSIEKGHIAVEFLYDKLPERARFVVSALNEAAGTLFFSVLAWQCLVYALRLRGSGEVSPTIQMPTYPFILGVSLSCVLLALILASNCVRETRGAFRK